MNVVGLTGGIGRGKTTVAKYFEKLGVPVYISDIEAKRLMRAHTEVKTKIIALLGEDSYVDGDLNRTYIASKIFNDKSLLEQINGIVHPAVTKDFEYWITTQNASFVIKETAILFEIDGHKSCDFVITVVAPLEDRIKRIMQRDQLSREQVLKKIDNQFSDEIRLKLSDFAIFNDDLSKIPTQIDNILKEIKKTLKE
ncbi:MAG: dephospho-CoA kinase [Flavobacteriaceae bacterium]|nr:dephospho-CoA kinase [Flavobacteriaceae bacterium]